MDVLALLESGGSVTIPPGPRLIGLHDFAKKRTEVGSPVIQSHLSSAISETGAEGLSVVVVAPRIRFSLPISLDVGLAFTILAMLTGRGLSSLDLNAIRFSASIAFPYLKNTNCHRVGLGWGEVTFEDKNNFCNFCYISSTTL